MKRCSLILSCVFSLVAAPVLYSGCKDNINTMLNDYNTHFEPATNMDLIKNPGDAGFNEDYMLDDLYNVSSDGNLNLAAPYNCKSYEWVFYKTENNIIRESGPSSLKSTLIDITDKLDFFPNSGKNQREFRIYVPKSQLGPKEFLGPGTYVLKLTVTGNNDKTYTDWCLVVIYEQIYGKENFFKEE